MFDPLSVFLENMSTHGLEFYRSFYGTYRAFVVRNDDPENRGRIQVTAPPFGQGEALDTWIDSSFPGAGPDRGTFWPPEVGDTVWVRYERGRPDAPQVYYGGWHGVADMPAEFTTSEVSGSDNRVPERRGFVTRAGHMLIFSDVEGEESVRLVRHIPVQGDSFYSDRSITATRSEGTWSTLLMEPDGSVRISNDNGTFISMDATNNDFKIVDENGNSITTDGDGIKVIDKDGNFISLDKGSANVVTKKDVTVQAKSFTTETGSSNLSKGKRESIILGETYTQARAQRNGKETSAWASAYAHWTAMGPAAQTAAAALTPLASTGVLAPLAAALIPFFQAVAPTSVAASTTAQQAAQGIGQFEAKAQSYLSKKTKSA